MPNGIVNRKDFDKITEQDVKLGILFESNLELQALLKENIKKIDERFQAGNRRFGKLEKRKWFDKGLAAGIGAISGFIGGFFKG